MKKDKILVFNISTDSDNTSLGFAIDWLNELSEYYDEVDVVTLNKGKSHLLKDNINIYTHESVNLNKIKKFIFFRKTIKSLVTNNEYKFCLAHMTTALLLVSSTIFKFRKIQSILWYTHKGPTSIVKRVVLYLGAVISDLIITASKNSFPLKFKKVMPIGHAINFKTFFRCKTNHEVKDFLIISRVSSAKNIDESIQGFLDSNYGDSQNIIIVGGPLTQQDKLYENYLLNKYSTYSNIKFVGSVPHSELNKFIDKSGFHINNTPEGFYDKSVLETLSSGVINFYSNSEYDKSTHPKYIDNLKFDSTNNDLSQKINTVYELENRMLMEIIKFAQDKVKQESLETLHQRILKVI